MLCSRCRREVPEAVRYCPYCGKRLTGAARARRALLALGLGAAAAVLLGVSAVQFWSWGRQSAASPDPPSPPVLSQSAPRTDPSPCPSPSMAPAQTANAEQEGPSPGPSAAPAPFEALGSASDPTLEPTPGPTSESMHGPTSAPTPKSAPAPTSEPSPDPTPVPTPAPEPGHPPAGQLDKDAWSGRWVFSDTGGAPGHYFSFDFDGGLVVCTDVETGVEVRNPLTVVDGATVDEYSYGRLSSRYVLRTDGTIARIYYYDWSDPPYDAAWTATLVRW